jgi:hypothetical protein
MVELLAPHQTSQGLPLDPSLIIAQGTTRARQGVCRVHHFIELVSLADSVVENWLEIAKGIFVRLVGKAHTHNERLTGQDRGLMVSGCLRAHLFWIYPVQMPVDNSVIDTVLDIGRGVLLPEQAPEIGLILGEK